MFSGLDVHLESSEAVARIDTCLSEHFLVKTAKHFIKLLGSTFSSASTPESIPTALGPAASKLPGVPGCRGLK